MTVASAKSIKNIFWGMMQIFSWLFSIPVLFLIVFLLICNIIAFIAPVVFDSCRISKDIYIQEYHGRKVLVSNIEYGPGFICSSGDIIVPSYENQSVRYDEIEERISQYKYNKKWIIIKTDSDINYKKSYYIIDRSFEGKNLHIDDIKDRYVELYTDSAEFARRCREKGIKMKM